MDRQRTVLLVEDITPTYVGLKDDFTSAGWQVIRAEDWESTLKRFAEAAETGHKIDALALDLGLPPDPDNPLRVGLPLAKFIREMDETLPLLTYTTLSPLAVDFALLTAELLPLRASFIYIRHLGRTIRLSELLEMTWQGYTILSSTPADCLPRAIATRPDPLSTPLWETLKLLSEGRSDKEIARELPDVGEAGVKARLTRLRETLSDIGEIEMTDREDLIAWYRQHHVRYRRE